MVTIANAVIQGHVSGQYGPPLWGPVLLGTISGCGGLFLPFDKGLSALKDGAPYALQVRMCDPNGLPKAYQQV